MQTGTATTIPRATTHGCLLLVTLGVVLASWALLVQWNSPADDRTRRLPAERERRRPVSDAARNGDLGDTCSAALRWSGRWSAGSEPSFGTSLARSYHLAKSSRTCPTGMPWTTTELFVVCWVCVQRMKKKSVHERLQKINRIRSANLHWARVTFRM